MSGSLYQYTPYSMEGQSPGQAFRSGFVGGQEIEANALRMDELRQMQQMREAQNQRAQAAEQRLAQQFPLDMKAAGVRIGRDQQMAPLTVEQAKLQIRGLQQGIADRAALNTALRGMALPALVAPGAPTARPAAGVAVPGSIPGFMAPEAAPTPAPATPAAATPGPQASSYFPDVNLDRRFTGVQTASAGISPDLLRDLVARGAVSLDQPTPEEPADLTGRGAPVGMPTQSAPPRVAVPGEGEAVPGGMEAGLAEPSPLADAQQSLRNFLANRSDDQLREIVARGTPSTVYGQRSSVTAGQASLAESARALLEQRASGTAAAPTSAAARPAAAATGDERLRDYEAASRLDAATQRRGVTTTAADTAVERSLPPSQPYILEPLRIEADRRRLTTEYGRIQQQYAVALASRNAAAVAQLVQRADQINQELTYLNGMTAITQFRNGDVAPLAGVLHQESGGRLSFQPRSDGTFNLFLDGRLSNQGVSREQIEASARMQFDTRFQEQVQQRQQQTAQLALLRAQEEIKQGARVNAESLLEIVKAQAAAASPNLDVQRVTGADGQQMIVVVDKRTGQTVSGARIIQVPPPAGSGRNAQPTFTIEPMPVGQR